MRYKVDMERRLGMDESGGGTITGHTTGPVIGLDSENRPNRPQASTGAATGTAQPPPSSSAPRSFSDDNAGGDDDDIYG